MNFDIELKNILNTIDLNNKPNLFLHICCAPCSSYVLDYLYNYFNVFVVFYNPNIDTKEEFIKRLNELKKLISLCKYDIKILYEDYNHNEFVEEVKGYESEKEGGLRCPICFNLRFSRSLEIINKYINDNSLEDKINYFCSTLSISPHKNANILNDICEKLCLKYDNIKYLPNDFKKSNGYLKSIELSKLYDLYRQDYCGCEYAKNQ